ncbi:MAG: F0F1 ATP synthase subunit A [bacterium]
MEQFSLIKWLLEQLRLPHSWGEQYMHIVMAALVAVFLFAVSLLAWRKLRNTELMLLPDGRTTTVNVLEVIVGAVLRLMEDVLGPKARAHMPLIGSLFIYILVSNLIGVIPGLVPPTENVNTNAACAIVVFIYYNVVGIRDQGIRKYLKHMAGPVIWLAPLLFVIEAVSHLVRPLSLSVRLLGNVVGDHLVLGMFSQLVPLFLPIVFMGLAIFVSFMQAFVFTLLSIVYIQMASGEEESL